MFANKGCRRTHDVGVEGAAQAAVGGHNEQQYLFFRTYFEERMSNVLDWGGKVSQNSLQLFRIWSRAEHAVLCPPKLRSRNRFHRFRELLRVFHRANAAPNIQQAWHDLCRAASLDLEP